MSDEPKAPLTTTTSIWPAAGILLLAVAMLLVFMVINLASDQGVTKTKTTIPLVVGGLNIAKGSDALDYCKNQSEIPSNISDALIVPVGTVSTSGGNIPNAGAGDFDCYQPLTSTTNSGSLLGFYSSELQARGWNVFSHGASNGSPQTLFQKAGDDGFYWVVGVTVNKSAHDLVDWTFRIYQNSETI
jgi:hypothetical protein